jgi:hypothetical protein
MRRIATIAAALALLKMPALAFNEKDCGLEAYFAKDMLTIANNMRQLPPADADTLTRQSFEALPEPTVSKLNGPLCIKLARLSRENNGEL